MRGTEFDDTAFLARLRAGDEAAFSALIRRYHGALVGVAAGIIGSRAQAEEIVQDTWVAVVTAIGGFEGRSSLVTWLFTIATNRARTRAAREGRLRPLAAEAAGGERAVGADAFKPDGHWQTPPLLWDVLDPERVIAGRQLWIHAAEAIGRLPPGQRAVLIMRDIEGRSAEDACALLDLSPENQRVLLHRARGRLRRAIDELIGDAASAAAASRARPRRALAPARVPRGTAARRLWAWLRRPCPEYSASTAIPGCA